ncbi:MAG: dTDP-glucose 4,6-dehydratase [SAR202 cluster bacterium]|nr:dTDP-glucose 4,6-dehydratase [SAR202 cluster bacterium]
MTGRTILVTGGCGFIGSNFLKKIIHSQEFERVINLDVQTYAGNIDNIREFLELPYFVNKKEDIRNRDKIHEIFSDYKPDIVVNFAAESHVDRSIENPSLFIETNIYGTQNLIDSSISSGVKRFVQISTDEVYGDLEENDPPFTELSPINPSSPYSASKASADFLVLAAVRTHGFPALIARCSNNYGKHQHPEKLIPKVIINSFSGKPIPVYGKGRNVRDWIFVDDFCEGISTMLSRGKVGEIYNFGGNCEIRNIDLVRKIINHTNSSEELIKFVEDRPGHDFRYAMNFEKSENDLGWRPKVDFDEGLDNTISWYSSKSR